MRTQPSTRSIRLIGATGKIRTAKFDGRDHIVVPVVGLMQAVIHPVNAPSPEFVPVDALVKAPGGWNGRPVVTDHPFVGDQAVSANDPRILETMAFGMLFNTASSERVAETGRLEFEAWLDPEKADAIGELGQSVIRRLEAGEPIEVSVGAIVTLEDESGTFEGKSYRGRWVDIVPDHLAMLPEGAEGACSNKMGCGARAARHRVLTTATGGSLELLPDAAGSEPTTRTEGMTKTGTARRASLKDRVMAFAARLTGAAAMTDNELHRELSDALRAVEPGFMGVDDVDQSTNTVYYCCAPEDRWQTFQRTFTQADGVITLGADRIEVEPVVRYEPVTGASAAPAPSAPAAPVAASTSVASATVETPAPADPPPTPTVAEHAPGTCKCQSQSALSAQGEAMHKNAERIKALIGNPATPWTEADQPFLESLTDERLAQFEPAPAATTAPAAAAAAPATVTTPVAASAAPAEMSEEDFLRTAPKSVRDMVAAAKKADADKRAGLMTSLKANQTEFTEAELNGMTTEQLERFDRMLSAAVTTDDENAAPAAVDFSARAPHRAASSQKSEAPNGYAIALAKQKGAK